MGSDKVEKKNKKSQGAASGKSARPQTPIGGKKSGGGYNAAGKVNPRALRGKPAPVTKEQKRAVQQEAAGEESRRTSKRKGLKIFGIIILMLIVVIGCLYAAGTYYYSDKFFVGTTINGVDCSGMTPIEVEEAIARKVESYAVVVKARNTDPQVIKGSDMNYKYMSKGEITKLLKEQDMFQWVMGYTGKTQSYKVQQDISFSTESLKEQVLSLNCTQEANQIEPQDAYVAFQDSQFVIIPETEGCKIDVKKAYQIIEEAVAASVQEIDLSQEDIYATAAVTKDSPELAQTLQQCQNYAKASITYTFGETSEVVNVDTVKGWLSFDESGRLLTDDAAFQQHAAEYVASLAAKYDTVGTTRLFNATDGRQVSVYGYTYGWKIDQAAETAQLIQEIKSGQTVSREPVYTSRGNNRTQLNDLGNTYIEVDLTNQHMYVYQNGAVVLESDFVSGDSRYEDRKTPPGIFTLTYKRSPDVLRGAKLPDGTYEYEEPVDYWMPFNGGIGFHDAPWRSSFGGDIYTYNGSHGCINLPPSVAQTLYSIIDSNIPIVCFY